MLYQKVGEAIICERRKAIIKETKPIAAGEYGDIIEAIVSYNLKSGGQS